MQQNKKLAMLTALVLICASTITDYSLQALTGASTVSIPISTTLTPAPSATNTTNGASSSVDISATASPTVTPAVIEITAITAVITLAVASAVMAIVKRRDSASHKL